eukprot:m.49506 g.49506  ORF g.49506 m.49506 type:complete len:337 (+) comp15327_c0_seq6:361-1371(+)
MYCFLLSRISLLNVVARGYLAWDRLKDTSPIVMPRTRAQATSSASIKGPQFASLTTIQQQAFTKMSGHTSTDEARRAWAEMSVLQKEHAHDDLFSSEQARPPDGSGRLLRVLKNSIKHEAIPDGARTLMRQLGLTSPVLNMTRAEYGEHLKRMRLRAANAIKNGPNAGKTSACSRKSVHKRGQRDSVKHSSHYKVDEPKPAAQAYSLFEKMESLVTKTQALDTLSAMEGPQRARSLSVYASTVPLDHTSGRGKALSVGSKTTYRVEVAYNADDIECVDLDPENSLAIAWNLVKSMCIDLFQAEKENIRICMTDKKTGKQSVGNLKDLREQTNDSSE